MSFQPPAPPQKKAHVWGGPADCIGGPGACWGACSLGLAVWGLTAWELKSPTLDAIDQKFGA